MKVDSPTLSQPKLYARPAVSLKARNMSQNISTRGCLDFLGAERGNAGT